MNLISTYILTSDSWVYWSSIPESMTWPEKREWKKRDSHFFRWKDSSGSTKRTWKNFSDRRPFDVFGVFFLTWTWGVIFSRKKLAPDFRCWSFHLHGAGPLSWSWVYVYVLYMSICMYYIVNHCWFPGFKLPTSNASRNEASTPVEALGAADGPLRVAHHTGGKLMSTSQGAGWEPLWGTVGSTSRKRWRGDVEIGLMMLMIRSVFLCSKEIPMLALVEVSVFELWFFKWCIPGKAGRAMKTIAVFHLAWCEEGLMWWGSQTSCSIFFQSEVVIFGGVLGVIWATKSCLIDLMSRMILAWYDPL